MGFSDFRYAQGVFRPVGLESVFLFVTSTCNSLCRTCFYWDELNQGRDLTFAQIERLSQTAPEFHKLWISGGEPFLRKELAEIIELFYRNNRVRHINLPTNGLLPAKVESVIDHLLERCPELVIDLNFSLDGLANTHDAIRGVPNNFQKSVATMEMAAARWKGDRRLRCNVVTCVTSENYRELVALGLQMMREADADGHYFEIIRGNPLDAELKKLPRAELIELHRRLMWFHEKYAERLFRSLPQPARSLARAYYLGNIKFHFQLHEQNHYSNKSWPMPCTAGKTTVVIDHDGHFRGCELRSKLGRVQEFDFDLGAVLRSPAMQQEIAAIPAAQCWCTHSCWIHSSAKFSPKVLLFHIPWAYLRSRWERLRETEVAELQQSHGAAALTLFALPKAFHGHIGTIQRNAIRSWTLLEPRPEILLFGDDEGTAEVACELGVQHLPAVARNEYGTPLLSDLFQQAQSAAQHPVVCYVNSDIILLPDFVRAVEQVAARCQRFLIVGRRTDLDLTTALAFENGDWEAGLRRLAQERGKLNIARSIDYFAFSRGLYPPLPPMALGRFWWDNWLIWKARSLGAAVVDASSQVTVIHQNHDHSHYPGGREGMLAGEEAQRNCRLGCAGNATDFEDGLYWRYHYTMDDATHLLTAAGLRPSHRHGWKMVKRTLGHPRSLVKWLRRKVAP